MLQALKTHNGLIEGHLYELDTDGNKAVFKDLEHNELVCIDVNNLTNLKLKSVNDDNYNN